MSKQRLIDANELKKHAGYYCVVTVESINAAPTIDAIPVEWLREKIKEHTDEEGWQDYLANSFGLCVEEWQKEQEAR